MKEMISVARLSITYRSRFSLQDLLHVLLASFLFLTFTNFVTRNYYWMFIAFSLFLVMPKRTIVLNFSTLFLFVLGVTMLVFGMNSIGTITGFLKPFVFFMAYVLGYGLPSKTDDYRKKEQFVEKTIYLCTFGFFFHYMLNFFTNLGAMERDTIDYWTGTVLSATGQASLATMGCAVIVSVMFSGRKAGQKAVAFIFAILIVAYNLILAGRTLLYMLAISLVVAYLYNSVVQKKNLFSILLTIGLITTLVVLVYNTNLFNIRTVIEDSNLYQRLLRKSGMGITNDLRFDYKYFYLKNLLNYPFGGCHIRAKCLHYAHDLYLDTYDEYGVLAFLAVIAYILSSMVRWVKCLRNRHVTFHTKLLVLCTFTVLNIQFCLEPIMDGTPFLFVAYCLIDGVLSRFLIAQPTKAAQIKE